MAKKRTLKRGTPSKTNGPGPLNEARSVFGKAAKLYEKLEVERGKLLARLSEIDKVLGQLGSMRHEGAPGAPAPRRRGRPPKAGASSTVREAIENALRRTGPMSWNDLVDAVQVVRPDVQKNSIGTTVQKLRKDGVLKVVGKRRNYRYLLA